MVPGTKTLHALEAVIDIWGINNYPILDWGDFFENWAKISEKPMFVAEYGADSFDTSRATVDEDAAAYSVEVLTKLLMGNTSLVEGGVCLGGTIFEFTDELWKDSAGSNDKQENSGINPGYHNPYPDGFFNEEWWGLLEYGGRPRKVFWAYAKSDFPDSVTSRLKEARSLRGDMAYLQSDRFQPEDLRFRACGYHPGCQHELGFCCPAPSGSNKSCCEEPILPLETVTVTTSTASTTERSVTTTTTITTRRSDGQANSSPLAPRIRVEGRQLLVDGVPIHLKGVCWNPVPRNGTGASPGDLDFAGFAASDIPIMAKAGINAVRTYNPLTDRRVLDMFHEHGIYVLNTILAWGGDTLDMVKARVDAVKDHPAVLFWILGNEWNWNHFYDGKHNPPKDLELLIDMATHVKEWDSRPVATAYGMVPGTKTLKALDDAIDIWGINNYPILDWGDFFESWAKTSTKPMFVAEYGADAFDMSRGTVDEDAAAYSVKVLTNTLMGNSSLLKGGVCLGGTIFEFTDELWKDMAGSNDAQENSGINPGYHNPYPDGFFNEEWWGLLEYGGRPRKAFFEYAKADFPIEVAAQLKKAPGFKGDMAYLTSAKFQPEKLRFQTCGYHHGCQHQFGLCCPAPDGKNKSCCDEPILPLKTVTVTTTTATTSVAVVIPPTGTKKTTVTATTTSTKTTTTTTTTTPPACEESEFQEAEGFADGFFEVGTLGCNGTSECQFQTLNEAQDFCNCITFCRAVLQLPFEANCSGGLGCYLPRYGKPTSDPLWQDSGGRIWQRKRTLCANHGHDAARPSSSSSASPPSFSLRLWSQ